MSKEISYKEELLSLYEENNFPEGSLKNIDNKLSNKNIILYGAGEAGMTFLVRVAWRYSYNVYLVLDRKFDDGDEYCGIRASSPFSYQASETEKRDSLVVVAVGKRKVFEAISSDLADLGYKNILYAVDFYEYQLFNIPDDLATEGFAFYKKNKENCLKVFDLLSDSSSRKTFLDFIATHIQRKTIPITSRELEEQYFPADISLSKGYSRVINCGAYNGDTVKNLNGRHGKIEELVCFEPETNNFKILSAYLNSNSDTLANKIILFPCGVFDGETQIRFEGGNMGSSRISEKGDSIIQCVAIDNVLTGFHPTFINMDIEGAELMALKGAEQTIRKYAPDLAVCVYHSPSDIWEIPLYLDSLNVGYRFYLRCYTEFTNETVLYATV